MKQIEFDTIVSKVKNLCMKANYELPGDVKKAFDEAIMSRDTISEHDELVTKMSQASGL